MHKERAGTIGWICSTVGWAPSVLGSGMYSATKAAMRGPLGCSCDRHLRFTETVVIPSIIAESQCRDISLSLRSIHVDLGWFRAEVCSLASVSRIADYDSVMGPIRAWLDSEIYLLLVFVIPSHSRPGFDHTQPGDPAKDAEILVDLVRGEGVAKEFPRVIGLGQDYYLGVKQACKNTLEALEEWQDVTRSTDVEPASFP
ncbi:hypothetical protein SCP_0803940 [Sparassis crispa]|uniref:Uncharacterized protein n=1 Tax=Sparassis crispa TaxID=139825 RepID=A0A401GUI6_9APHY|nr:hypothetical protein SCP_0803940 [Sparassis crispa]GBE85872.1 hypothetical protein SCP_0803940 [Sparassis crispa]